MAQILVRELEDRVVSAIKRRAKANNRSLEGEVRTILGEIAERDEQRESFIARLRKLRAEFQGQRPGTDSAELLREAREEREAQWDSL
jgi:antitoxin FitA